MFLLMYINQGRS